VIRHRAALSPVALLATVAIAGCSGSGGDSSASTTASPPPGTSSTTGSATTTTADVDWPYFGRVEQRTHYIAEAPDPPFHMLWEFFAKQLIEFPPDVQDGFMFVVNKTGQVFIVDVETGKIVRQANLGNDVTGPAYSNGILYVAQTDGDLTALDPRTGKTAWTFKADSELESSPMVSDGKVYFGSDNGDFYALDAATGKQEWKAELGHEVKASPSIDGGTLYVGDYEGTVWALDAATGKKQWSTDTTTLPPGGDGGFYSSPSVAFGNVYEARTDGTVYALAAGTGKLAWQFQTSNSIYSSPAAAQVPGTPPTVYVGSYDHQLYALDAASGKKRWVFNVGGVVPGTPTVVGTTVYTSSFQNEKTFGVDAKTGKRVFEWGSAGFTPVVSDGERVFLSGFQTVWAFDAKSAGERQAQSQHEQGSTLHAPGPQSTPPTTPGAGPSKN
jgi:outer membrane protein assembly factor BamB